MQRYKKVSEETNTNLFSIWLFRTALYLMQRYKIFHLIANLSEMVFTIFLEIKFSILIYNKFNKMIFKRILICHTTKHIQRISQKQLYP